METASNFFDGLDWLNHVVSSGWLYLTVGGGILLLVGYGLDRLRIHLFGLTKRETAKIARQQREFREQLQAKIDAEDAAARQASDDQITEAKRSSSYDK